MLHKEEFLTFNKDINPFDGGRNCVTIFMESKKRLTPEVEYLIYNESRVSALSYYYGMSGQNNYLAKENGLRFIFSDYRTGLTPMQMLQHLSSFKTVCFGELPVLIIMDFMLADSTCAEHAFVKGIRRVVNELKRKNVGIKMVFILPSKSPFKVSHDLWLLNNDRGLIKKISEDETVIFACTKDSVDELRESLIYRTAFNALAELGTGFIDMEDAEELEKQMADFSYQFDKYYEVS